jgi:resuscitation-promoting factor RpfB
MSRRQPGNHTGTWLLAAGAAGLALAGLTGSGHHHHHHGLLGVLDSVKAAAVSPGASTPDVNANVALGRHLAAQDYGWTGAQFRCLNWLWTRESGWSNTALNPKSGADGIAQALGHGPTNQYPAGPANPPANDPRAQIEWGLGYIHGTYTTPCRAWAHETADGWY